MERESARQTGKVGAMAVAAAMMSLWSGALPAASDTPSPLAFDMTYTAELWRNVAGGVEEETAYLDNLDVTLGIDADRLWGWPGTRIFLYGLYNNGTSFSEEAVGDRQIVSNIETGVEALRLYEAWIETPVAGRGSLLFGLFDLNSEFDVLDTSGLFINSAHGIGTDFGQSGKNGPSIFPVTSLALRLHWRFNENLGFRTAIFDGVPGDPDDPGKTTIRLGGDDGALLVGELEWSDDTRRILAGAWYYTAEFEKWPDPAAPEDSPSGRGNGGVYLRGETVLGGNDSRLRAFGRIGVADDSFNVFSHFLGAGLTLSEPLPGRVDDTFGVALAWAEVSEEFQALDEREEREVKVEITYRMPLGERVVMQPDLQYIINPGLLPNRDHAWALGLRIELSLAQ